MSVVGGKHAERPLLWLLPVGVLLVVFFAYPLADVLRLSFTNANLVRPGFSYTLSSYANLFGDPDFYYMLSITLIYVFASVALLLIIGLSLALAIDAGARRGVPGSLISRTTVLVGWAIPGIIAGVVWKLLLSESQAGLLTYLFELVGVSRVPFLSSPPVALGSLLTATVWRNAAFSMILFYAGLQTIPLDLIEQAMIDGASAWQRLVRVTLPYILPITTIILILSTIGSMNRFAIVVSLTGGGPGRATEVIALHIYSRVFREFSIGPGAAVAMVLLLINLAIATLYYSILIRRKERA